MRSTDMSGLIVIPNCIRTPKTQISPVDLPCPLWSSFFTTEGTEERRGAAAKVPQFSIKCPFAFARRASAMSFDTLVVNGRVVTATDTYPGDIAITNGKIEAVGQNLSRENATRVIDAEGKYVLPGGIDVHTHLDMPFGGTTSADDFETGTRAAAFGGTTTLIDFAIQYKGQTLRTAFDTWMQKASGKAVCDYAFHCIITDLAGAQLDEMNALVRDGVTSFKLFMAYPGVFMLDDGSIFKALRRTAQNGGLLCMHAENGSAIDVIVQQALAEGKRAPKYHALTRPTTAEAEATAR